MVLIQWTDQHDDLVHLVLEAALHPAAKDLLVVCSDGSVHTNSFLLAALRLDI